MWKFVGSSIIHSVKILVIMHNYMNFKKLREIFKPVLEFIVKLFVVLGIYFIWALILRDPHPYVMNSGPFFAIPFMVLTIYIWRELNKKYKIYKPQVMGKASGKAADYLIKIILFLSVYAVWLIILVGRENEVFDLVFNVFESFYYIWAVFTQIPDVYLVDKAVFYAIPLTIISICLWKLFYNKGWNLVIQWIKQNWIISLIVADILVVLIWSLFIWLGARQDAYLAMTNDAWYALPDLSRAYVRDGYNLAFQKIILFAGLLFTSAFLLIKVIPNKK